MLGTVSDEIEVNAPASALWEVYGTLELAAVVEKGLAALVQKIEVLEGDGSAGTLLNIVFQPGGFAFPYYKEKYTKVDNEKRVKEAEVVEGGYLEIGFNKYLVRFEVIEKDEENSITRATIEYDIKEELVDNASFVSIDPLTGIMNLVANHVLTNIKGNTEGKMFGTLSGEVEVNAPASVVWEVYSSLQLAAIVEKGLTDVIEKIEVVEGDGSVGTVLKLLFRPGVFAFPYCKEKFVMIDHEKRVKDVIVVEGGYLDMGFDRYLIRLEIIDKDEKSCITKSTIEYDIKDDYAANASLVSIHPLMLIMNLAAIHILAKTN